MAEMRTNSFINGEWVGSSSQIDVLNPATGKSLASVANASIADCLRAVDAADEAFDAWKNTAPRVRGEILRKAFEIMIAEQEQLARLITLEMGKILQEGLGEVQEAIDIADFAVGQSRMLYGLSMHSERPGHAMREQWHPFGVVGCITAFNFPMAVWAWNSMLAWIAGDSMVWKPSDLTPLCAIGLLNVVRPVLEAEGFGGLAGLVIGPVKDVAERMPSDPRMPLISFTGSIPVGKHVAEKVASRLGRSLLELGGNNAIVVMPDADLDMAVPAIVFGAVGTAGQRCTSTRRVLVHESIADELEGRLVRAYEQVQIGNPMADGTLCGPLIHDGAVQAMEASIAEVQKLGGKVLVQGGRIQLEGELKGGHYVKPAIVRAENEWPVVQRETFAPLLYVIRFTDLEDAIQKHNAVPQGLSSSIFTLNMRDAERFLSAVGSDCGIANVNIGTSGAEIGGAFGGEKETGWGRESGSDSWKAYMRRQTNTVNWSDDMPLAQGIKFG